MDIFKVSRVQPMIRTGDSRKSKESTDRDPQQGGEGYRQEEPATQEEAKQAEAKLAGSAHFVQNSLTVEVRESEGKYFLDIFDPQKRKIKTIGAVGIRAILSSYKSESPANSRILDERI